MTMNFNGINGVIVIGGSPQTGKTTFALHIIESVSRHGKAVFFSLEKSKEQIEKQLLSNRRDINMGNVFIDDSVNNSVLKMTRKLKYTNGLRLVVIDYLQLIASDNPCSSRKAEITIIAADIKKIAAALSVPVIVLSQLSHGKETQTCYKPILSDFLDAGAITEVADIVLLLHRDSGNDKTKFFIAKDNYGNSCTFPIQL